MKRRNRGRDGVSLARGVDAPEVVAVLDVEGMKRWVPAGFRHTNEGAPFARHQRNGFLKAKERLGPKHIAVGVHADNVETLAEAGIREFHLSGMIREESPMTYRNARARISRSGDAYDYLVPDRLKVKAMSQALQAYFD